MKGNKIVYWIATSIILVWFGLMPLLFFNNEMSKQGFAHFGFPEYFRKMVHIFSAIGALILVLPWAYPRLKEWAYAGFTINIIGAIVSNWVVDGFGFQVIFPLLFFIPLAASYFLQIKKSTL